VTEQTEARRARRPRVLRVIARLNVGGPAWQAVLLSAGTRERYPTLLAIGSPGAHEGDATALADEHGVDVVRIPGLGREVRLLGDLRALWTLWRLCRRLRPDVVHTHTAKAGTLGRLAAWLAGVPVRVHTFHGHVFHGYFSHWRTAVYIAIERLLARITTRIIAISPRQADELRAYLRVRADKITVIPLGFDLRRLITAPPDRAAARQRFRSAIEARPGQTVVTMVGRLTGIKNQPLALEAFASLGPVDALLVLVGGGEEEDRLHALARSLGIEQRVRFAGWWQDLAAVYYGSDVVALSSDNEGTPVCLIEALACGRAVVATAVGGVADVLDEGRFGVLVPPGRVEAFAQALARLIQPAERGKYEALDHSAVIARYDLSRLVADVQALYDELLAQHPSRRKISSMRSVHTV
jgi:glycosyltransferase involved in cell wall biosynthesis